jgi:membrane-bound lytic murein transglycosylase D
MMNRPTAGLMAPALACAALPSIPHAGVAGSSPTRVRSAPRGLCTTVLVLGGLLQALLVTGCASSARQANTLEAPPLIIEVPAAGTARSGAADAGAPAMRTTTVATLEELVAVVEPPASASAAMAAPASAGAGAATGTGAAAAFATPSPLVPARLVERGELPGDPGADSGTPAKALGPLVAPPLPASAELPASAADAAGGPTDPLEPEQPVQPNDPLVHTDLWDRIRDGYGMADLDGALVREHERWYAARPDYVQRMTDRGSRYLYHILQEVKKRNMPTELALLPFIESAYNPQAMSTAKASGMWQFIPSTGRNFALAQNVFRDERRDVLESTRAALDYLGKLHGMFGDWRLALAAYNWGEGNVGRAIARNQRARKSTRYEDLVMPAETRHYLPKLQAVKNIVNAPEKFGLTLPELRNHPYFLSVPIYRDMDVSLAARLALMEVDEFRTLNPQFDRPVILAAGTPQLLLPYDNADEFGRNLAAWRGPLASWTAWQLPRTVKPADAAKIVGVSEETLREVNHIPPRMLIKAGSVLLVPRDDARHDDVSGHLADNAQMLLQPDGPLLRRVVYRAARGDNVAAVARRYRVAPAQLAQWNKVGAEAQFAAGSQVVIYVPSATTHVARAAGRKRGHTAHAAAAPVKARPVGKVAATRPAGKRNVKSASTAQR